MNKFTISLTLLALALPVGTLAQDDADAPRPERERPTQRERGDRPDRPVRPNGERDRDRSRDDERSERRPSREPIPVEQIAQAIETLRALHDSERMEGWLTRIEKTAEDNPEEAARHLSRFPRLREMMDARQHRPEEFELHREQSQQMRAVFMLMREVHKAKSEADNNALADLRGQLRDRFEQLFEIRLQLKEFEIKRIRDELGKAEQELAQIKADRDKLIDEKLDEMMNKDFRPRGRRESDERGEPSERGRPERKDREE